MIGILKRTGTPADRAVFVNMEGFYLMEGHAREVTPEANSSAPKPTAVPSELANQRSATTTIMKTNRPG